MNYNEINLHKVHQLTKDGMSFMDIISKLRVDKVSNCNGDNIDILINTVCDYYEVNRVLLKSRSRLGYIVEARRMYCYLARVLTPKSLKYIGSKINRDHATVLHQYSNMAGYVEIEDSNMISDINKVTHEYGSNIRAYEYLLKNKKDIDVRVA